MSPRNTVSFLRHLCLKVISNQLIYALSDDEGKYYRVVEKYLSTATYEVLQDLIKIILNSVNLDASIRFSCLELLLRSDVKELNTGMFPQFYYDKILTVIAARGKRLEHLNLKGVWVKDYPDLLCEVIRKCENLRSLMVPHMANDDVLRAISDLKKLAVLNISGETYYSVESLLAFKCDSLRVLDIGSFGKINVCQEENSGFELISSILENLPNLEYLKTYSHTGKSILYLYDRRPDAKLKLKYLHDTGTSISAVTSIIKLCPNLENIHLDTADNGVIEQLSSLTRLNTLKITRGRIEEILNFLYKSGSRIQVLTLNNCKDSSIDLSTICYVAPELQTLECFKMNLTFSNRDNYFMTLQNVELLYCDMTDNVVKYILANAPFVKRFVVGSVINMTDGDIFRICAECEMTCLEELWFSYARCLTSISVELLMGHCPNLKVLGELGRWDISLEDLDLIRIVIALTNTDLVIS